MVLSFRTILSVCGAALIAARPALAYDPYLDPYAQNSARQNREWQARNEHYDAIAAMNSARGPLNAVAPVEWKSNAQRQREWNETLARIQAEADAKAAGDRAWEAHLAAYSAKINAQNAEIDRINEDIRRRNALNEQKSYEDFVAKNDGMGTKRMPPPFASQDQAFRWHLQQAQNGDVYGAFFVGRALMAGNGATKNHNHALLWLEKSNPAWPLTNTLLGALLVNGEGIQPDPQRGRELLKKGAANDQDGVGAWIYGNILRSGAGLPADVDLAAQQLRMAVVWTEKDDPYDGVSPRLEWWPSVGEWDARAFRIRQDFAALVAEHPERVAAWAQEWTSEKVGSVSYNSDLPLLQKSFSAALPKMSREARLRCLDEIEQRDAPALGFFRQEVLAALLGAKQDEARALLPWQPRRGADSYFSRLENPDQAKRLWTESGAQVETWAQGENALAAAARRALLARDMGFWPSVAPVQPPAVALAHLKAQKDAPDLLEREIRRAAAQGRVPWNDASATQKWLDGAIANDVRFQTTKQSIATWQQVAGTEKRAREFDERLNTARVALEKRGNTWTSAELDAATLEFNNAERLRESDPDAALAGFFKAFEGGDALAAYQLLGIANGPNTVLFNTPQSKANLQYLVDSYDSRLQRDADGPSNRAATAALALHLLHREATNERYLDVDYIWANRWRREYRPSQASTRDWLALAREKGHPMLLIQSPEAEPISNDNHFELTRNTAFWQWLSRNGSSLAQSMEVWRRDHRVLGIFSPEPTIAHLQELLDILEASNLDARKFMDTTSRLEAARLLCASYDATPGAFDFKKAAQFSEAADEISQTDRVKNPVLPALRVQMLENYVQAALHGDSQAPLLIAGLVDAPGFPLRADHEEAKQWAKLGRERLKREAEKAPVERAAESADVLASEYESDTFFPVDEAAAWKYHILSANLGYKPAAESLADAYEEGWPGLKKDAAEAAKWKRIAAQIEAGTYKVPPQFLTGRDK